MITPEIKKIIKDFEKKTDAQAVVKFYAKSELSRMLPDGKIVVNEETMVTVGWKKMIDDIWYGDWVQYPYSSFTDEVLKEILERFRTDQISNINQSFKIGTRYGDIIFPA